VELIPSVPGKSPKTIVYLRPDSIGDLILFTSALGILMAERPKARHVIVVREGYESLKPLFPASLEWLVAGLNPFKNRPAECRGELAALLADLEKVSPDLILAPTLNRTWLEIAVASHFPAVRSVVLGRAYVDPIFASALQLDLEIDPAEAFKEVVPAEASATDVENQHRMVEYLLGSKFASVLPAVAIPEADAEKARAILKAKGLKPGEWIAVFPGGLANVQVKAWPEERFAELVTWIRTERNLPVLMLAHADEALYLERIVAGVERQGGPRPAAWLGKDGELPLLAALLRESRAYVGHDTGAMHIAAAVGRPVVGIFGGGHWPRFRPAARQAISVVQPLPCFGCNWDCHFGDGPCVKTLRTRDVTSALGRLLDAGSAAVDQVAEAHNLSAETLNLIAASTPGFVALKRDRLERQHRIEELKSETNSKDVEIEDLKRAAEERKAEMESIKAELEQECADKTKEIEEKDVEIADLKRAAEERKAEMESIKAELEQECADKDTEIGELKAEADTKDREIGELKQVCNEREALIITLDGHIKSFQKTVAEKDAHIANVEAESARIAGILAKLPPDAEQWSTAISHKDVHIENLGLILASREKEISEQKQALSNYASGYGGLEQAKHFSALLAEKEAVIRDLHRACVERERVINGLAVEATGLTSGIGKIWSALRFKVREKLWRPLRGRFLKMAVDDYWMQIGVMKQYEPRPIAWDSRIRIPKLPAGSLPKIGIVTPSFGQPAFLESTMLSVLNQDYPNLLYVVQDGGSPDHSPGIIERYASRLRHWQSAPDKGQADAIRKGFSHIEPELGPDDLMAWFNSDDLVAPRALGFVAAYFARHPEVDVVYGHRIIIDEEDREVGRWVMPRHDPASLEWIDYVPQETLFWRKRAWDAAGGIDPAFQFALDWDLLARFQVAGCRIVRLPYFLGCFRIHAQQKTIQAIHTTGADEMARIRTRFHGAASDDPSTIERHAQAARMRGALLSRLMALGVRW
jgi:ADP-heptose:LPS heptosyltransferase